MKPIELKIARVRKGLSRRDVARTIGIAESTYGNKETGRTDFTAPEAVAVAELLELTWDQYNDIFYDGTLPIGNMAGWSKEQSE